MANGVFVSEHNRSAGPEAHSEWDGQAANDDTTNLRTGDQTSIDRARFGLKQLETMN